MMKSMIYKPPAFMEQPNSRAYNISTLISCYTVRGLKMMLIQGQEISKKLYDNYEMRYISISRIRMKKYYTTRKTLTKTYVINAKSRTGITDKCMCHNC